MLAHHWPTCVMPSTSTSARRGSGQRPGAAEAWRRAWTGGSRRPEYCTSCPTGRSIEGQQRATQAAVALCGQSLASDSPCYWWGFMAQVRLARLTPRARPARPRRVCGCAAQSAAPLPPTRALRPPTPGALWGRFSIFRLGNSPPALAKAGLTPAAPHLGGGAVASAAQTLSVITATVAQTNEARRGARGHRDARAAARR